MSDEMKRIGTQMANVMFNMAQMEGERISRRSVEIMDGLRRKWDAAIRATPSPSTAPTEQNQAVDLNVLPPFVAPAGFDKDAWVEEIGNVAELYGRLLAKKQQVHIAKGLDRGTEYYIADGIRWAISALERRRRAQGGVTNSNSAESGTAPIAGDELPPLPDATSLGWNAATAGVMGYTQDDMRAYARAALASQPAAREAARQSIDTLEFAALIGKLIEAAEELDDNSAYSEARNALIAHIDTWGARRDAVPANAELLQAADAVVERWHSRDWKQPHTAEFINRLAAAIGQVKFGGPTPTTGNTEPEE